MTQPEPLAEVNAAICLACNQFVERARLAIPLDRVAVVLLEAEGDASRIVFSWQAPAPAANPAARHGHRLSSSSHILPAAAMNIPLYDGDGQIGEVLCRGSSIQASSPRERELVRQLAEQLAMRLENATLSQRLQAREEEISAVDEIAQIITSPLDIHQVYAKFARGLRKLVDFHRARISLIDHQAGVVIVQYLFGARRIGREVGATSPLQGSQAQYVSTTGQTLIREIPGDHTFRVDRDYLKEGLRSFITVPLASNGRVIGTLGLRSRRAGAYGPREQAILERLASQIAPVVENAQLYDKIKANLSAAENRVQKSAADPGTQVDLAHMLRTPLTAIKGYTSSLLRPDMTWPPELQREFLQTIEQETDRLDQAVTDLLAPADSTIEEA